MADHQRRPGQHQLYADLFREFLHRFERSGVVTFSWASSNNRIGEEEFGGGAAAMSRDAALLQTSTETALLLSLALQGEPVADEATVCKIGHLLEAHNLDQVLFAVVTTTLRRAN